jgi:hypothetical protein
MLPKQFSIRELLLLIAVVAVALGWWVGRHDRVGAPTPYELQVNGNQAVMLESASGKNGGNPQRPIRVPQCLGS